MQTSFTLAQLADPDIAEANKILRACVHCGFCTATCPTYVLLGDELDSPRGRIYLIKDMLENDKPANAKVALHVDRCLSCLSCMTTCPSGVHYMHLVDHARAHIEDTYKRPFLDRALRSLLARILPYPQRFRLALLGAWLAKPLRFLTGGRIRAMLAMAPAALSGRSPADGPQVFPAEGPRGKRVALLAGCAQPVLKPGINEATIRLLTRHGVEVVIAEGAGCCGALPHHMGKSAQAHGLARANIAAWTREIEGEGLDAIVVNTSGCGTPIKDYGFMFREDAIWAERAARVSALTRDISEFMAELGLAAMKPPEPMTLAYHSACSLQHGQKITAAPKRLLEACGFTVRDVPEGHLCCGSAGTYNILQPALARQLRDRKVANIESARPDAVATGNIGCIMQIAGGTGIPVLHTVELLDWATGGPRPASLPPR
ncbi:MAG: glycolate oxidase subunit GlcF [Dongiaceae bacterium]